MQPRNSAKFSRTFLILALFLPYSVMAASPQINEFVFNHDGQDTNEFVEVKADPNTDLAAFTLLSIEGDGSGAGVIDRVFSLGITNSDGYWTTAFFSNALENTTNTLLLVEGFTGSVGDDLDADNDGLLDSIPWTSIIDSIAVNDGGGTDQTYSSIVLTPSFDGLGRTVGGASQIPDGSGIWVRNDFDGAGLPSFPGAVADAGEAMNTPGMENSIFSTPPAAATFVINELDADTPGSDSAEFVELYDGGVGNTPLDGLVLVFFNGSNDGSYRVFDLDGFSTRADGYFLLGNAAVSPDILFNGNGLQNGPDAVGLYIGNAADFPNVTAPTMANLVDAIVYGTNDADDTGLLMALGVAVQNNDSSTTSIGRDPDDGEFTTFSIPTPGANNTITIPPLPMTTIPEIQGPGHRSALDSQSVRTRGIVTAVDSNGFYLQDVNGDFNIATSEGIFVFTSSPPVVTVGDDAEVTGIVKEQQFGNALPTTQISNIFSVTVHSQGNFLPAAVVLGIGGRQPPTEIIDNDGLLVFEPLEDAIDFYETLEGMRVVVPDAIAVSARNRFNEIWVVANDGINASNLNNRGGITLTESDFNPERIQIQLDSTLTPGGRPPANVGDSLGDVTGIVSYSFGNFEILATAAITPVSAGLTPESTNLNKSEHYHTIASFNVLNLDANDLDGDTDVADGRFEALAGQIVANLRSPDIIALQEIQDDSGSANDGVVSASLTASTLIAAVVTEGGPIYEYFDVAPVDGADGGQPGSNIRVGYLYNPDRVDLNPASIMQIVDTTPADGDDFANTRKPLAAEFTFNGQTIHIVNNHLSSKTGSSSLFGQVQPAINSGEDKRTRQAQIINDFADGELAVDPDKNLIVLGDFNEFDFNRPLGVLKGNDEVLTNLAFDIAETEHYSFNFDGNSQALDHILVSNNLLSRHAPEFDIVHTNSEFANSASDHDPILMRMFSNNPPVAIAKAPLSVECQGPMGALVQLDGSDSFDAEQDSLSYQWHTPAGDVSGVSPLVELSLGSHDLSLTVNDGFVDSEPDLVKVTVEDTTAPTLSAGLTVIRRDDDERVYRIDISSFDACGSAQITQAVLKLPRHRNIPVSNGQVFQFEYDDESEVEMDDGILEIEAPRLVLKVTAEDDNGNIVVKKVKLAKSRRGRARRDRESDD